ncbi:venom acid phosphatase Acph-1-like [Atheta coriaria]|uniref:venom acid phosphatase Acph-1-like n=1 Tax=Dalotia coriaria TaxID=877792 RepID=UPI0031F3D729
MFILIQFHNEVHQKFFFLIVTIAVISAAVSAIVASLLNNNNNSSSSQQNLHIKKNEKNDTLISVQVVFRHGHRTPEPGKLYKLDPYNNYSFHPENYGELTTKGRKVAYDLGQQLRQKYDSFLGKTNFYPGLIKSFVSGYDRTQMSLQCVHAGLFPNKNTIMGIPWQPIPYEVFEFDDDNRIGIMAHCKTLKVPHIKPTDNTTKNLFEFLSEKSGENITSYYDSIVVSNAFQVETGYGLELPEWGKPLYPHPLLTFDEIGWAQFAKANIRLGAGGLLKMITENALRAKMAKHSETEHPKMVLYSGHDYTLLFLRHSLKIANVDSANFGAHLIFELHKIHGHYGFKIFYNNYQKDHPISLKVPFCENDINGESFCKLNTFIKNTEWYYDPTPVCY